MQFLSFCSLVDQSLFLAEGGSRKNFLGLCQYIYWKQRLVLETSVNMSMCKVILKRLDALSKFTKQLIDFN